MMPKFHRRKGKGREGKGEEETEPLLIPEFASVRGSSVRDARLKISGERGRERLGVLNYSFSGRN